MLGDQIKQNEMGSACSMHGHRRRVHGVLIEKNERRRPLRRPRYRFEDNIKMDLQELGWEHGLNLSGS
jgi:hypothetical protein